MPCSNLYVSAHRPHLLGQIFYRDTVEERPHKRGQCAKLKKKKKLLQKPLNGQKDPERG